MRCIGRSSNRSAVGARLLLRSGEQNQLREIKAGSGYASHNDRSAHFGLGASDRAEGLEIRWPSRKVQRLFDVKADRILTVEEPP